MDLSIRTLREREDEKFSDLMQYLQEERFLLRHMEREEPQGEENGEPMLQCQMQQAVASAAARYVHMLSKTNSLFLMAQTKVSNN